MSDGIRGSRNASSDTVRELWLPSNTPSDVIDETFCQEVTLVFFASELLEYQLTENHFFPVFERGEYVDLIFKNFADKERHIGLRAVGNLEHIEARHIQRVLAAEEAIKHLILVTDRNVADERTVARLGGFAGDLPVSFIWSEDRGTLLSKVKAFDWVRYLGQPSGMKRIVFKPR
jgi:hypothetical protein